MTPALFPIPTSSGSPSSLPSGGSPLNGLQGQAGSPAYSDFSHYLNDPSSGQPANAVSSGIHPDDSADGSAGTSVNAPDADGSDDQPGAAGYSSEFQGRPSLPLRRNSSPDRGQWPSKESAASASSAAPIGTFGSRGSASASAAGKAAWSPKAKSFSGASANESASTQAQTTLQADSQVPRIAYASASFGSGGILPSGNTASGALPGANSPTTGGEADALAARVAFGSLGVKSGMALASSGFGSAAGGGVASALQAGPVQGLTLAQTSLPAQAADGPGMSLSSPGAGTGMLSAALMGGFVGSKEAPSAEAGAPTLTSVSRGGRFSILAGSKVERASPAPTGSAAENPDRDAEADTALPIASAAAASVRGGRTSQAQDAPSPYPNYGAADSNEARGRQGAENIAASPQSVSEAGNDRLTDTDKKSLSIGKKTDTDDTLGLGTTGAKSSSAMPAQSSARPFALSAPAAAPSETAATKGGAEASKASAREAVQTVVRIADAQAGRSDAQAHVVNLGFKIGGESLSVRVEMHGNEVRTQFSTDSSELRVALSGEWQGFSPGGGSHDLKFSDPVFSSGSDASGAFSGGGGADSAGGDPSRSEGRSSGSAASSPESGLDSPEPGIVAATLSMIGSAHLRAFA